MRLPQAIFTAALLILGTCTAVPSAQAAPLDFVVVQPGQPGTPQDARPVMDALAEYLAQKTGLEFRGEYYNQEQPALNRFKTGRPAWGIVSLGFYMEQAKALGMTPMASTRPDGQTKDIWRLIIPANGPADGPDGRPTDWKTLSGTIRGSMLFEPRAAACVLFDAPTGELPFQLEGTSSPLRSLRKMLKGRYAAVVLDRPQFKAAEALPSYSRMKVLLQSPELPASPVVWFGTPNENADTLSKTLMNMGNDPAAAGLLQMLRTDGFGPADPGLAEKPLPMDGMGCR